jgi:hypothetical protein
MIIDDPNYQFSFLFLDSQIRNEFSFIHEAIKAPENTILYLYMIVFLILELVVSFASILSETERIAKQADRGNVSDF